MKWFYKSSIYIFNLTVFHEEFVDNSKKGVSTVLESRMFCSLENKFILKKKWPIVKTVGDIIFNIIFLSSTSYLKWFIKSNIVRIKKWDGNGKKSAINHMLKSTGFEIFLYVSARESGPPPFKKKKNSKSVDFSLEANMCANSQKFTFFGI